MNPARSEPRTAASCRPLSSAPSSSQLSGFCWNPRVCAATKYHLEFVELHAAPQNRLWGCLLTAPFFLWSGGGWQGHFGAHARLASPRDHQFTPRQVPSDTSLCLHGFLYYDTPELRGKGVSIGTRRWNPRTTTTRADKQNGQIDNTQGVSSYFRSYP